MENTELKKVQEEIDNCKKQLSSLRDKEIELILDKDKYINKYVRIKDIGHMHIQDINIKREDNRPFVEYKVILWGAYYGYEVGPYFDENWAEWNLYTSISIPANDIEDRISIISRKEYVNGFDNMISQIKRENNR